MNPSAEELEIIAKEIQEFAKTKFYMFRCVDSAVYDCYAPVYFESLLSRSTVMVSHNESGELSGFLVYETVPGGDAFIVNFAWTAPGQRNRGVQKKLWGECGITADSNVFVSPLSVLSEKLIKKRGWLLNPFSLLKGIP